MNTTQQKQSSLAPAKKNPVFFIGAVVILVLMAIFIRSFFSDPEKQSAFYEVKRSDFLVTIVEGGELEAVNEEVIRNEVQGQAARIIYIVPEGSTVKKGDLLVELDTGEAEERVNQQEISYEKAKSALVQSEQGLEIQKSVNQSSVDKANLSVEFAEIDLEKYNKADKAQLILQEEVKITTTTSDLLLAKDKLEWSRKLYAKGFESKNNVDSDENRVLDLTLQLKIAHTNLWALNKFESKKMLRQYESDLEEAGKELDRVIAQGESKIAQMQADVMTQSNSTELTRKRLEADRLQLKKSKIYAPQDGLVVYAASRSRFSQQSMIEEGAMVRNQQPLIKLPDTSKMKVVIKVHESHVGKVHSGLPAFVVLDPLPDQRFKAQVTKVSVLPNTQERFGNPNLKVYDTEILIQDKLPDNVKPGVSARAEIIITNVPNAMTVPIQAITSLKGSTVAFVKKGGGSEPVEVKVGLFNTKFIQVISGLSEGDLVLLSPPYDAEEQDLGGSIIARDEAIDPEEMKASMPEVRSARTEQPRGGPGGQGGRGRLGEGGRNEGRRGGEGSGFNREAFIKQYDKNGDGELDESEREAMRQQFQQRSGGQRGGAGFGGRGGNRSGGAGGADRGSSSSSSGGGAGRGGSGGGDAGARPRGGRSE